MSHDNLMIGDLTKEIINVNLNSFDYKVNKNKVIQ